ncbi:unnamed protein product [Acanthoscelides obtectus]|uniref:Uncharacterized protein n=1 Tax=Acanthoscelides obtectus TaxID=200917 RepID=A0A9P0KLD5_ACAOB|nr:unnamed protein product [Acanthoscelides obtectus]CAK1644715.1 hypothetical protein AOBTE_LOCUS13929 [Acanthoscelides obtectus]
MGNALSSAYSGDQEIDPTLENTKIGAKYEVQTDGISSEAVLDETATCTDHIEQLREFEADLKTKREQRRGILRDKKMEFDRLRSEVERLNQENILLKSFRTEEEEDTTKSWSKIVELTEEVVKLKQENESYKKLQPASQSQEENTAAIEENEACLQKEEIEKLRKEIVKLKRELEVQKRFDCPDDILNENERLRRENDGLKMILDEKSRLLEDSEKLIEKNRELRISISKMQKELQELNTELIEFEKERQEYNTHVLALKDVISVSKNMLQIREAQLKELKQKVESIEASLQEKEMNILSQDLRMEYERQLENMRSLRTLYQERSRIEKLEREQMQSQLEEIKKQMEQEQNKNKELQERMEKVEADNSEKYDEIKHLESSLGLAKAEGRQYQAELTVINQLFSEILLGFNNSQDIDLDKLQRQLEDHHDLLQDIVVNEVSSEVSYALPKLLLDLLNNADTSKGCDTELENIETEDLKGESSDCQQPAINSKMNSPEEIVQNLPKVWRVLIELLSHQMAPTNSLSGEDDSENPCYKTVQTAKGPSLVASVSQTFIRLKDLILEKKALEKETNHLKQLNGHLENRLQDQAKRLEHVQSELSKTWHVVGKLQKQHHLLHTQEKILRYELAQKRKLLTDLKEELEYSREKSAQAREKNTNTEQQWRLLRNEFASRKKNAIILKDDINNSVESGYSDDRECSSEDEPGYETDVSECAQKNQEDVGKVCDVLEIIQNEIAGIAHVGEDSGSKDITDENVGDVSETVEDGETTENGSDSKGATSTTDNCDLNVQNRSESQTSERETNAHEDKTVLIQIPTRTTTNRTNDEVTNIRLNTNESVDVTENISSGHTSGDEAKNDASEVASTSSSSETFEERLARREERLKRLEGQASNLVNQAASTATKSVDISNKLDSLHKTYGSKSKEASDDDDEVDGDDQK